MTQEGCNVGELSNFGMERPWRPPFSRRVETTDVAFAELRALLEAGHAAHPGCYTPTRHDPAIAL